MFSFLARVSSFDVIIFVNIFLLSSPPLLAENRDTLKAKLSILNSNNQSADYGLGIGL
jgi:hypothetical protein